MRIYGGINLEENGRASSVRGMHVQTELIMRINENVNGYGQVGYQKKENVVSSFSEYLGVHGVSEVVNDEVGRVKLTSNPLDLALAKKGYFQYSTPYGVELTRDGRFMIDKEGFLVTLENNKVLSNAGEPIKLNTMPKSFDDIKIGIDGVIKVIDRESKRVSTEGTIGVVSSEGQRITDVDVRQGFTEDSNVILAEEFYKLIPMRRNFQANKKLYSLQDNMLSQALQSLGQT